MKLTMRLALLFAPLVSGVLASVTADAQIVTSVSREYPDAPQRGYVPTPFGWTHESCVFVISGDARIDPSLDGGFSVTREDGSGTTVGRCRYRVIRSGPQITSVTRTVVDGPSHTGAPLPTVKGWELASAAFADEGSYFKQIHTTWTVPLPPKRNGGVLYFFNGLEPELGNKIIQPVLQYGRTPAGGGNYWAATSWLVEVKGDDEQTVFVRGEELTRLSPGEVVTGHVVARDCLASGRCSWSMWLDGPRGAFGRLYIGNIGVPMTWAYRGVAEFYNVTSCDQMPASRNVVFTGNKVYDHADREIDAELIWNPLNWQLPPACAKTVQHIEGGAKLMF